MFFLCCVNIPILSLSVVCVRGMFKNILILYICFCVTLAYFFYRHWLNMDFNRFMLQNIFDSIINFMPEKLINFGLIDNATMLY